MTMPVALLAFLVGRIYADCQKAIVMRSFFEVHELRPLKTTVSYNFKHSDVKVERAVKDEVTFIIEEKKQTEFARPFCVINEKTVIRLLPEFFNTSNGKNRKKKIPSSDSESEPFNVWFPEEIDPSKPPIYYRNSSLSISQTMLNTSNWNDDFQLYTNGNVGIGYLYGCEYSHCLEIQQKLYDRYYSAKSIKLKILDEDVSIDVEESDGIHLVRNVTTDYGRNFPQFDVIKAAIEYVAKQGFAFYNLKACNLCKDKPYLCNLHQLIFPQKKEASMVFFDGENVQGYAQEAFHVVTRSLLKAQEILHIAGDQQKPFSLYEKLEKYANENSAVTPADTLYLILKKADPDVYFMFKSTHDSSNKSEIEHSDKLSDGTDNDPAPKLKSVNKITQEDNDTIYGLEITITGKKKKPIIIHTDLMNAVKPPQLTIDKKTYDVVYINPDALDNGKETADSEE